MTPKPPRPTIKKCVFCEKEIFEEYVRQGMFFYCIDCFHKARDYDKDIDTIKAQVEILKEILIRKSQ